MNENPSIEAVPWTKSSWSNQPDGNCVEVRAIELAAGTTGQSG